MDVLTRHHMLVMAGVETRGFVPPDDDELDEVSAALVDALERLDGETRGKPPLRIPKGFEGGGRFRSISDTIFKALKDWAKGDGPDNPFEGMKGLSDDPKKRREQLRKAAVARGITLRRGASENEIANALLADARKGKGDVPDADEPDAKPKAKPAAKKAVPKAAQTAPTEGGGAPAQPLTAKQAKILRDAQASMAGRVPVDVDDPDVRDLADRGLVSLDGRAGTAEITGRGSTRIKAEPKPAAPKAPAKKATPRAPAKKVAPKADPESAARQRQADIDSARKAPFVHADKIHAALLAGSQFAETRLRGGKGGNGHDYIADIQRDLDAGVAPAKIADKLDRVVKQLRRDEDDSAVDDDLERVAERLRTEVPPVAEALARHDEDRRREHRERLKAISERLQKSAAEDAEAQAVDRQHDIDSAVVEEVGEPSPPAAALSDDPTVREVQIENRIRAAYRAAGGTGRDGGHEYVSLADIRDALSDLSRDEQDEALHRIRRQDGVRIIPVHNTKALTGRQFGAALRIGGAPGQDAHALHFDDSSDRPLPTPDPLSSLRTLDPEAARDALDLKKVDDLKALIRQANERDGVRLPVSGRKRDLVDRLVGHLHPGGGETTPDTMTDDELGAALREAPPGSPRAAKLMREAGRRLDARRPAAPAAPAPPTAGATPRPFPPGQHSWSGHDGKDVTDEENLSPLEGGSDAETMRRISSGSSVETAGGSRGVYFGTVPDSNLGLSQERINDIRAAVEEIVGRNGTAQGYVQLSTVREELAGRFPRAEVDRVLQLLNRSGDWTLVPDANQKALRPRDRLAAVLLGNADKHSIRVQRRMEPAPRADLSVSRDERIRQLMATGMTRKQAEAKATRENRSDDMDAETRDRVLALAEMRFADEMRAMDDNELKRYWTVGEGLKRWRFHPHPWTKLRNLLLKHVGPGRAERMASEWFHLVFGIWPGERKGDNPVGPG